MIHFEFVPYASFEDSPQDVYMMTELFRIHHDIINKVFEENIQHLM